MGQENKDLQVSPQLSLQEKTDFTVIRPLLDPVVPLIFVLFQPVLNGLYKVFAFEIVLKYNYHWLDWAVMISDYVILPFLFCYSILILLLGFISLALKRKMTFKIDEGIVHSELLLLGKYSFFKDEDWLQLDNIKSLEICQGSGVGKMPFVWVAALLADGSRCFLSNPVLVKTSGKEMEEVEELTQRVAKLTQKTAKVVSDLDRVVKEQPLPVEQTDKNEHCLVCGEELSNSTVVKCRLCHTLHHEECWEYNGKCAVFGCGGLVSQQYVADLQIEHGQGRTKFLLASTSILTFLLFLCAVEYGFLPQISVIFFGLLAFGLMGLTWFYSFFMTHLVLIDKRLNIAYRECLYLCGTGNTEQQKKD